MALPPGNLDLAAAGDGRREEVLAVGLDFDGVAGVTVHRDDDVARSDLRGDDFAG